MARGGFYHIKMDVFADHIAMLQYICVATVCAEAYDPDEDDEDDADPRVVHPKSDVQRHRLQDACRDILLFKTLDQVPPCMGALGINHELICLLFV